MKKVLKMIGKILGIILLVILVIGIIVYAFVLQYPKLKDDPKVGKWYRVTTSEMKTSEGDKYRALFKKGSENKVLIYFAGGGVSCNEDMAREDTYNTKEVAIDMLANLTMNMGGIASDVEGSPFPKIASHLHTLKHLFPEHQNHKLAYTSIFLYL